MARIQKPKLQRRSAASVQSNQRNFEARIIDRNDPIFDRIKKDSEALLISANWNQKYLYEIYIPGKSKFFIPSEIVATTYVNSGNILISSNNTSFVYVGGLHASQRPIERPNKFIATKDDCIFLRRTEEYTIICPTSEPALIYLESMWGFPRIDFKPSCINDQEVTAWLLSALEAKLDHDISKSALEVIAALKSAGGSAASIRNHFLQAGLKIVDLAEDHKDKAAQSTNFLPLPTVAPKLWSDNTEGLPATAFVAKYYKPWIDAGVLSLNAIGDCDPDLPKAYRNRKNRHPSEAVALVRSPRSDRIEDPQEAIDRVRDAARESAARRRAAERDGPTNEPG